MSRLPIENNAVGILGLPFCFLFMAGLPIVDALIASLVMVAVGLWGVIVLGHILKLQLADHPISLWLFGPCLFLGLMGLFLLRMVTSMPVFLFLFVAVPAAYIAISVINFGRSSRSRPWVRVRDNSTSQITPLSFGLCGGSLLAGYAGWSWLTSFVVAAVVVGILRSLKTFSNSRVWVGLAVIPFLVAVLTRVTRLDLWYIADRENQVDEPFFESLSHALVTWGPQIDPSQVTLNGAPAIAYHHLVFLAIGIIDFFTKRPSYESVLVIGPVLVGVSITSGLIILVRQWLLELGKHMEISKLIELALYSFVLGLTGAGFSSLSSTFGVSSLVSSFFLLSAAVPTTYWTRMAVLACVSVSSVTFSKISSMYAAFAISTLVLVFGGARRYWKAIALVTVFSLSLIQWMANSSSASSYLEIGKPFREVLARPSFGAYELRLTLHLLIQWFDRESPRFSDTLLIGLCSIVVLVWFFRSPVVRRNSYLLSTILFLAVLTQLLVFDPFGGHEYFFHPGVTASFLLLTLLACGVNTHNTSTFAQVSVFSGTSLVLFVSMAILQVGLPLILFTLLVIVGSGVLVGCCHLNGPELLISLKNQVRSLLAVFIITLLGGTVITGFVQTTSERDVLTGRELSEMQRIEWFISTNFTQAAEFIRTSTPRDSLFASKTSTRVQVPALTRRRFLFVGEKFLNQPLNQQAQIDQQVVNLIGLEPTNTLLPRLAARGVDHLLIERSLVNGSWIRADQCDGVDEVFSNEEYRVFKIDLKFAGCST